jgi:outer membrane receptor protein involved in Fe transport
MAAVLEDHYGPGVCGSACSVDEDAFEEDFLNYRIGDVKFFFEDSSTSTVFNLPSTLSRDPDPVFGQRNTYPTVPGFNALFHDETERRYGLRVDLDSQVDRVHRAKAGIEWNWVNLSHSSGSFDSYTFADVYDVDPVVAAVYVQDRLDFGDLVIDLGLRWDHWDPNTLFPAVPSHVDCSISSLPAPLCRDAEVRQAPTNDVLAPRLGVAHPITDDTQVRLSYGKFYQLPELRHFFFSFLTDEAASPNPNTITGNPNLDFIETTAFEAGITHQLGPNVVLDVVGYNRDRRGAIRLEIFQTGAIDPTLTERRILVNGDNGNVKGFDLSLTKRYSNYWTMDLAWSLQWARGTTSSPLDWAFGPFQVTDPLEGQGVLLAPPTQLQPEDFDRLHNINAQFTLQLPEDFADGTAWGKVFENSGLSVTYNAQSGLPYTRISDTDRPLEDFNASRQPWFHSGDIRLTREFPVGAIDLVAFAYVRNFLDRVNVLRVNESTGLPDRSGLEFTDSRNPSIPGEYLLPGVATGFPVALDDVVEELRDEFSRQDLDGDGSITLAESQETLFRAEVAQSNVPSNYGEPRQVRLGIELRF